MITISISFFFFWCVVGLLCGGVSPEALEGGDHIHRHDGPTVKLSSRLDGRGGPGEAVCCRADYCQALDAGHKQIAEGER